MPRKYLEYTDEDIKAAAKKARSMSDLLRILDLTPAGGNYANMKRKLQTLKVDCSHWKGQGWSKGQQLKDWSEYTKCRSLKPHLIKDRGHKCEFCNRSKWYEDDIILEVHHMDGDRTNNDPANLQLLCANCHARTPNWRNKKRS